MGMTLKDMIKLVAPPVFVHPAKRLRSRPTDAHGLAGDYHSWDEAMAACTGYDSDIIPEKTRAALLKVKNGGSAHERDSALFDEIEYAWPPCHDCRALLPRAIWWKMRFSTASTWSSSSQPIALNEQHRCPAMRTDTWE